MGELTSPWWLAEVQLREQLMTQYWVCEYDYTLYCILSIVIGVALGTGLGARTIASSIG